ncbi:MAG: hypothetical protein Q4D54_06240 [Eubacteriales bacterium]|nr:hypothetical protein [Lachnospiraceae bacterium]MDO5127328.1 hypothetical protein [Eubacteriales bacterium]
MEGQLLYILIMLVEAAIIVFLIALNVKLNKKNKANNKMLGNYMDKLREDELDEKMRNEYYPQNKFESDFKNIPYETIYEDEKDVRTLDAICVHLACISRVATRKYIINVTDELYLGRAKTNGVVFEEQDVDQKHIHFLRKDGNLFVQNVSESMPAIFVRKDVKYELTESYVQLNDGDELLFDSSRVMITLL